MSPQLRRNLLVLLIAVLSVSLKSVTAEEEEWCIADEQTGDAELQMALDWACGRGGADCSKIQRNKECFLPNTLKDHASYAFNSYYQKYKHKGATCYFNSAALVTSLNPSHGRCKYEYFP
ncbi:PLASMODESMATA CALLOSE-BINDING PROTEIN 5 [Silene latifolia]|uniref:PLASMODESMATA CALLOSE-BINDING PROTEIN 5 n=1 Tax=Silene latifolia TaxID=37657 RepID=UPI003D76D141